MSFTTQEFVEPGSTLSRTSGVLLTWRCSGGLSSVLFPSAGTSCFTSTPRISPGYANLLDEIPTAYIIDHMARVDASGGLHQEPFQALLAVMRDERAWVKISGAERLTADGSPPYDDVVPYAKGVDRGGA